MNVRQKKKKEFSPMCPVLKRDVLAVSDGDRRKGSGSPSLTREQD